ncbi:MAG: tRNA (adenosine(37)-N6)-threonylcarbamoyltransferase complex ATPase subunit type 1 TsaE, partial [Halanaerobium sp.]
IEIIHMDLYRLNHSEELLEIGFEDYLDRDAVILIEWPEIALSLVPANFIFIKIIKESDLKRKIIVRGEGKDSEQLIERLNKNADSRD